LVAFIPGEFATIAAMCSGAMKPMWMTTAIGILTAYLIKTKEGKIEKKGKLGLFIS